MCVYIYIIIIIIYIYTHHVFLSAIQFSILPLSGITWCFQIFSHGVITGLGDPHGRLHQLIGAPESPTGWGPWRTIFIDRSA